MDKDIIELTEELQKLNIDCKSKEKNTKFETIKKSYYNKLFLVFLNFVLIGIVLLNLVETYNFISKLCSIVTTLNVTQNTKSKNG